MGKFVYVRSKKTEPHQPGWWSQKKKQEACVLSNSGMTNLDVATQINIPVDTLKTWKQQEWWKELTKELRSDDNDKLDAKLVKIRDTALDSIMDRLENGEMIYDQTTGKLKRAPVKIRDATVAFNNISDKLQLLRKEPTRIVEQQSSANQLENLAKHFAEFVTGKIKQENVIDMSHELIEGDTVIQNEDGTYELKE